MIIKKKKYILIFTSFYLLLPFNLLLFRVFFCKFVLSKNIIMLPYLIAGAIGFGVAKLFENSNTSKYDDGGDVYEKEKTYQVYSPITQNVEGYFENKKEAEQFAEKFEDSIVYDIREEEKVGKEFWFEYHCFESDKSCDAEIWYRSHQKVKVVDVAHWSLDDKQFRYEDGQFRVYLVEWKDGFRYDVFEDELMESKDEFERPDPPKRKDSVSNTTLDGSNPDILFAGGGKIPNVNHKDIQGKQFTYDGGKFLIVDFPNKSGAWNKGASWRKTAKHHSYIIKLDDIKTNLDKSLFDEFNKPYYIYDDYWLQFNGNPCRSIQGTSTKLIDTLNYEIYKRENNPNNYNNEGGIR